MVAIRTFGAHCTSVCDLSLPVIQAVSSYIIEPFMFAVHVRYACIFTLNHIIIYSLTSQCSILICVKCSTDYIYVLT